MSQPHERSIVVVEKSPPRYATGLLDPQGNPIFRTDLKSPIGFVWFEDAPKSGLKLED